MRSLNDIPSILSSLLLVSSHACHASPTPHQAPLSPSPVPPPAAGIPFTFRNATLEDIDDITTVWYDAFRPWPMWNYIYQFTDDVDPLYRWTCQRESFLHMLQDDSQDIRATAVTVQVPDPSTPSPREGVAATRERVVSVAMWDFKELSRSHDREDSSSSSSSFMWSPALLPTSLHGGGGSSSVSSPSPFNCSAHLDINVTRALHHLKHMEAAQEKYLRGPLGPQFYLGLLATHPDWDGNGFAAAHLGWGKAQLGRLGAGVGGGGGRVPLTLIATPAGYPLYVSQGFEGLKNVTVERLDGEGLFWYEVMRFEEGGGGEGEL